MKNIIVTLLGSGLTRTKKSIDDLKEYCYFIDSIAEYDENTGFIRCNSNQFWNYDNRENRTRLMQEIRNSSKGIRGMFSIYNEYENGNSYGIEK